jgi:glycogen debranching enzyme
VRAARIIVQAARATVAEQPDGPRTLPPTPRPVVKATDLGSTAVLRLGALTLVADPFGDLHPDSRGLGLYLGDTRILCTLAILVDGRRPTLLATDLGGRDRGVIQMTNPELRNDPTLAPNSATLATQSLGIHRERQLAPDGLHEHLTIANYTLARQELGVDVLLDVDGADIFEVRGYAREARGALAPIEIDPWGPTFGYVGRDGVTLHTSVRFDPAPHAIGPASSDSDAAVRASWQLAIEPGDSITLGWHVASTWDAPPSDAPSTPVERLEASRTPDGAEPRAQARFDSDDELVNLILARGLADIRLLETSGPGPGEAFIAAGVPWFATLFGRDAILASLFMLPVLPDLALSTLEVLARRQATERDDWRDAEPGKILHELRTGEMARIGALPFTPYYGSVDATPLWLLLLAETHAWTGDDALVDRLWPNVIAGLGWLRGAAMQDGFIRYECRSARGLRNQGWKDSRDSVRDRRGLIAAPPIALLEVQCYTIAAFRGMAAQAIRRGEADLAAELKRAADDLAAHVEALFWLDDLQRYAMAIDGSGSPADALASNVGHGLWAGALDPGRAAIVARDLAGPRMSSGWGLRTFAQGQPGYNPLGYHLGTVWPHDTAIAVAGLKRYGFAAEAGELATGLLDAARHFPMFRLPELFCGFPRADTGLPIAYPVACAPQAWAAASPFMLFRSLLGLEADAPRRELRITRPTLPSPMRKLVITGLRVGDGEVDLLFQSWRGITGAEVLRRSGDLSVVVRL